MQPKVLIVGDSRKMKGGVSSVIKALETSFVWEKYECRWLECQINASLILKILYLLRGILLAIFLMPRYQIVHFHTAPGRSIRMQLLFFLYAFMLRKKIILHIHVGNQLQQFRDDKIFAFCCKNASAIVVLGHEWGQYIPNADKSRVHVIYNPAPPVSRPQEPENYFLYASYLNLSCKSYDTLIEGWAIVRKEYPEWKLVICGAGEVNQLHHFIHEEHVEDAVEFLGWVDGERKMQLFAHARGYIVTSLKEGLPMSVLEALSIGVPVITTPVGSLPELLTHQKDALLYDFRDAYGLSQCIKTMITNDELRHKLIDNGQLLVQKKLSVDQFARQLDLLYASL